MVSSDRLRDLARAYGIQPDYADIGGKSVRCSPESLLAALRALGCDVASAGAAAAALQDRRRTLWRRPVEPVTTAWTPGPPVLDLRLPASAARGRARCHIDLESSESRTWEFDVASTPVLRRVRVDGEVFERRRIVAPANVPPGYHRCVVELSGAEHASHLIAAPRRAYLDVVHRRSWGAFLPLYALESKSSWGAGDFSDLQRLVQWAADQGASTVGVLPLLSTFLDECYEPSPYSPVSRLFWNEFYIDVTRVPDLDRSESARSILDRQMQSGTLQQLRQARLVDYPTGMRCKRAVLQELARDFLASSERHREFENFRAAHPGLDDYARFRAMSEAQRKPWAEWPQAARDGKPRASDYDPEAARYHAYVQWIADEQLAGVARGARQRGAGLYLDYPIGVHASGYDTWRHRESFALGVRVGAPPDVFFSDGQDWGFPPLHPDALRQDAYAYLRSSLRHHLQYARHLRLDHIMGLHRLYWIPPGYDARNGLYVRYPFEEMYAVLSLESHRAGSMLIGENLGTVPAAVAGSMRDHGLLGMHVVQYEVPGGEARALDSVPGESVASLNTHDMRPFAGFWQGLDVADRVALGVLADEDAGPERQERAALRRRLVACLHASSHLTSDDPETIDVIRACLECLAASPAALVLLNLEDLWAETSSQNIPSTSVEQPNWRRKARYGFEELCSLPTVTEALRAVARHRTEAGVRP